MATVESSISRLQEQPLSGGPAPNSTLPPDGDGDMLGRQRAEAALRESEARFRHLFESLTSGFALHEIILDGAGQPSDYRFLEVNPAFEAITGLSAPDLIGRTVREVMPTIEAVWIERYGEVATTGEPAQFHSYSGELGRHYRITAYCPERGRFAVICDDITVIQHYEEQLRAAAAVFEHTRDGVAITDTEGRITAVNRSFCEITGYGETEVIGRNPRLLQSGRHDAAFYAGMWSGLTGNGFWHGEIWNKRKNGEIYPEWLTLSAIRNEAGQTERYIGVFTDISRVKAADAKLEFTSYHDPVTALPNRTLLDIRHQQTVERARRHKHRLALLVVDFGGTGQPLPDPALIAIAKAFRARLREEDLLARIGHDEYAILMNEVGSATDPAILANALLGTLDAPFATAGGEPLRVKASIGISIWPDEGKDPAMLMRNASTAVYLAKARGTRNFRYYTESLTTSAQQRVGLEAALRKAIDCGELALHYQPLIDARNARVIGAEALLRWNDPQQGQIEPPRFLPIAENSGLIGAIGAWTMRTACAQMKAWRKAGRAPQSLSINLSPREFALGDVAARLGEALAENDLDPSCLEIEIAEPALTDLAPDSLRMLERLIALGVRLTIDNCGVGTTSVGLLRRFPIRRFKIARSIVAGLAVGSPASGVAATIVAIAHSMQASVIAVGVEKPAQLEIVAGLGCDGYQGFLFDPPLLAADFPEPGNEL